MTCDRSQCPELISSYDFNGHCPRVKFVYYVYKYLLVASFKLETAEIIRNSVTKDAFFYVPTHQDFQHLLQFNVHGQTYQFKVLNFRLPTTPLVFTSSKRGKTHSSVSQNMSSPIPGPLLLRVHKRHQFLLQTKNSSKFFNISAS